MNRRFACLSIVAAACIVICSPVSGRADEGFWLFSDLPKKALKQKHGAELSPAWLEQVQKACVRIGGGGSGAFVSPEGLIVTNHHVGWRWYSYIPGQTRRLVQDGFYAASRDREIRCPGLEVSIPWESEDVTERVQAAVKPGMSLAAANQSRAAVLRAIEKECRARTGLEGEVEALYHGGRYRLTRYRTYSDVRLVFAPESLAGSIFDCCFFRAYENDKPVQSKHYLRRQDSAPRLGDLVFVAGFPAKTQRFLNSDHLDVLYGRALLRDLKWYARAHEAMERLSKESALKAWEAWSEQGFTKDHLTRLWYLIGPPLEEALAAKHPPRRRQTANRGRAVSGDIRSAGRYHKLAGVRV